MWSVVRCQSVICESETVGNPLPLMRLWRSKYNCKKESRKLIRLHNQEIVTLPQDAISPLGLAMMAIVAPILLLTKF